MTREIREPMVRRVLVVDDDDAVMTSIAHIVRHKGYEPITASDWVGALEAIEQNRPDVILLDLSMPHVDGIALLKFIRERDFSIPVIVVSAFIDEDSRAELTKLGVSAFVAKPFTMADLHAEIQRALGISEEESESASTPGPETVKTQITKRGEAEKKGDRGRRRERLRRRRRELRKSKMKPKVMAAVAASCVAFAVILGLLNFYFSH